MMILKFALDFSHSLLHAGICSGEHHVYIFVIFSTQWGLLNLYFCYSILNEPLVNFCLPCIIKYTSDFCCNECWCAKAFITWCLLNVEGNKMFLASVISYASDPLLAFQVYFSTFGFPITCFTCYSNSTQGEVLFVFEGIPPLTACRDSVQVGGLWFCNANGILMRQPQIRCPFLTSLAR